MSQVSAGDEKAAVAKPAAALLLASADFYKN
jgi:hypothetical protein